MIQDYWARSIVSSSAKFPPSSGKSNIHIEHGLLVYLERECWIFLVE